jgi:hypothetical protein
MAVNANEDQWVLKHSGKWSGIIFSQRERIAKRPAWILDKI